MRRDTEPTQSAEYSRILPRSAQQSKLYMQDSYIGSTAASQAAEAGSTASILPSPDGRDAQHRSFWHSQKKMRSGTEPTQSAEYSRILPHTVRQSKLYMQDSYIGSTAASQAAEAGSTPVSCSIKLNQKRYQREKPRSFNDFRAFLRPIFEVEKKDIKKGFGKFDGPVPLPKAF